MKHSFEINYSTKMGAPARKSDRIKLKTLPEAKAYAMEHVNGDTYTFTVIDLTTKTALHYAHHGMYLSANSVSARARA